MYALSDKLRCVECVECVDCVLLREKIETDV